MNVTLTLSTPERPEAHVVNIADAETIRYTSESPSVIAPPPGIVVRLRDGVEMFDLACVLDVLVT